MQYEIIIEGPFFAIVKLQEATAPYSSTVESIPGMDETGQADGRIRISETDEERLDEKLARISKLATPLETKLPLEHGFRIEVKNLSYAEPSLGNSQFLEPFRPIPSIRIHPWMPSMNRMGDAQTMFLDPKNAFGTGKHPTTKLCLQCLERLAEDDHFPHLVTGGEVLDFGCGSGILALAAVKFGAKRALGVEIDADAACAAKFNVELNRLTDKISIQEGSWGVVRGQFDLIFANLVAVVHLRHGHRIPDHLKRQGRAVVSGFSEKQEEEMELLFMKAGLRVMAHFSLDGWVSFIMEKRERV